MNFICAIGKKNVGSLVITTVFDKWSKGAAVLVLMFTLTYVVTGGIINGMPGVHASLGSTMSLLFIGILTPLLVLNVGFSLLSGRTLPFAKERNVEQDQKQLMRAMRESLKLRQTLSRVCGLGPIASCDDIVKTVAEAIGLHNTVARLEGEIASLKSFADARATINERDRQIASLEQRLATAQSEIRSSRDSAQLCTTENQRLSQKLHSESLRFEHEIAALQRELQAATATKA